MGHERLGLLPKSQKWRKIVAKIQPAAENPDAISDLVAATAKAIDSRFRNLGVDPAVKQAFSVLVALTIAARTESPHEALAGMGYDLQGDPTPFNLARLLHDEVRLEKGGYSEYAHIALASAIQASVRFYGDHSSQSDLFPSGSSFEVWRDASDGRGFCELSRLFFASLTTGHFEYILEREASASLPTLRAREEFQKNLRQYIDEISRHSFETAKIAQSFAAGWYNKYAVDVLPSDARIRSFLRVATRKISSSLTREDVA